MSGARRASLRATRSLTLLGVLSSPAVIVVALNASTSCDAWKGSDALGQSPSPSVGCTGPITATMAAFPAASAGNSIALGGTLSGCPVYGVTVFGAISAAPVSSSYASWTASVPLATFESQAAAGSCPQGGAIVPLQVLITTDAGYNQWTPVDAGCVSPLGNTCAAPAVSVVAAYPAPASSSGPNIVIAGSTSVSGCPITGVTVAGAYAAAAVVPGFGAWTATVPLSAFESWAGCAPAVDGGVAVPIQVLEPNAAGVSESFDAQACAILAPTDPLCAQASVAATVAIPSPAASGPPSVVLAGTLSAPGCPVAGMTVLDGYPASAVGGSLASWTATVPLAWLEEQPMCTPAGGDAATPGYTMHASLLVPGASGVNVSEPISDAGCVALPSTPLPACSAATATIATAYALTPSPAASSVAIGGTTNAPGCPIAGLLVMGAYAATSLGSNFAAWSATVPGAVAQQFVCGSGAPAVPLQLIVPAENGLSVPVAFDAGCLPAIADASADGH